MVDGDAGCPCVLDKNDIFDHLDAHFWIDLFNLTSSVM